MYFHAWVIFFFFFYQIPAHIIPCLFHCPENIRMPCPTTMCWELFSQIFLNPARITFYSQSFKTERKRNRGEETLSGETNNVQNNTKHWRGVSTEFSREVERGSAGSSGQRKGQLRLRAWGENPTGDFFRKSKLNSHTKNIYVSALLPNVSSTNSSCVDKKTSLCRNDLVISTPPQSSPSLSGAYMWSNNQHQLLLSGQVSISSTLLATERVTHILHDKMTQTFQEHK